MKWLNRFLIFLLIVIVGISIGLSIYYFMRNNEVFSLGGEDGKTITKYVNVGETFVVTVKRTNPSKDDYSLKSMNDEVAKFKEKFDEDADVEAWRFEAVAGGSTTIQLVTANAEYKNLNVAVYVGSGSVESPFYVRDYQDLKAIGSGSRPLTASYMQVADIDMSIDKANAWTPIGGTDGFSGIYNGNKHTISNLHLLKTESQYLTEGEATVEETLVDAGLFGVIKSGAKVMNLNLNGFVLDGNYENAAALAAKSYGEISFVNVSDAVISSAKENANVAGVVATLDGLNSAYAAKVLYSTVNNTLLSVSQTSKIGGISAVSKSSMISNTAANITISAQANAETPYAVVAGGITNLYNANANTENTRKNAVLNSYAVIKNNAEGVAKIGGILGENINGSTNTAPELKPEEARKNYNRVLGNFYESSESVTQGVYGFADDANAYLAFGVTAEVMKKKPTSEQISGIVENNKPNSSVAFIGYGNTGEFASWNMDNLWNIDPSVNNGYPFIRESAIAVSNEVYDEFDVVIISNKQKLLDELAADLADDGKYNSKYKIDGDIDLSGDEWTPIGSISNPFNGEMYAVAKDDGSMPVIRNLTITTDNICNGFFGVIGENGSVDGLIIEGVKITRGGYAGGIAGISSGKIINCVVRSSADTDYVGISITKDDDSSTYFAGGIVGDLNGGAAVIQNCKASINISVQADSAIIGGIAASQKAGTNIVDSSYDGAYTSEGKYGYTITANVTSTEVRSYIGGIVGEQLGTVSRCNFVGKIVAPEFDSVYVGGISGGILNTTAAYGQISNSKATNYDITGGVVGGLVGVLDIDSTNNAVTTSSTSGIASGNKVGGLAGVIESGSIVNCYANSQLYGSTMAGFAVEIKISNKDTYGRVAYCFANSSFNYEKSGSKAYAETQSEVYSVYNPISGVFNGYNKVAGVVEKCIVNSKNGGTRLTSSYNFIIDWAKPDDGWTSDDNCKKISTFTNRGFDTKYWNFAQDEYPTLV